MTASSRWLGPAELDLLARLRLPKRRDDWLLGRWTAKQAVSAWLGRDPFPAALAAIEILPAPDRAPEAYAGGRRLPVTISLSHSHGRAFSAVSGEKASVGCDLEFIEPRSPALVRNFFTASEQKWLSAHSAGHHDLLANLVWSAKESALKLLRKGLSVDTRSVEVEVDSAEEHRPWQRLRVNSAEPADALQGWWREDAGYVLTVLASPAPGVPRELCHS